MDVPPNHDPALAPNPQARWANKTGTESDARVPKSQIRGAKAHAEGSCPGRDLNPYKLALTAPSKLRVYQFHHPGKGDGDFIAPVLLGVAGRGWLFVSRMPKETAVWPVSPAGQTVLMGRPSDSAAAPGI